MRPCLNILVFHGKPIPSQLDSRRKPFHCGGGLRLARISSLHEGGKAGQKIYTRRESLAFFSFFLSFLFFFFFFTLFFGEVHKKTAMSSGKL